MVKATTKILVHAYCSNEAPREIEVSGQQVGEFIVHREIIWFTHEEPRPSRNYWTVTHAATGLSVKSAMSQEVRNSQRRRDSIEWADRWQNTPPVRELLAQVAIHPQLAHLPPVTAKELTYAAREAGWRS